MNRRLFSVAVLGCAAAALVSAVPVRGIAAPGAPAVTDPAQAGLDFAVQGEYTGLIAGRKLAAQVVALGDDAFRAVFLPGGLPGERGSSEKRISVEGKREGTETRFGSGEQGWGAVLTSAGWLEGRTDAGERFSLRKTERHSPTEGLKPPAEAVVLFDGTSAEGWSAGKMTEDGHLLPGCKTRREFTDFTLHVEFRTPFMPAARGQGRGNSGVYLLGRYELQVLDSFGLAGAFNECGALYRQKAPDVNMSYPPLAWQTYDIDFEAARFDAAGMRVKNALITVRHNGGVIHDRVSISGPTGGAARRPEAGASGAIHLQNHGTPVHYRNIWLVERKPEPVQVP